MNSSHRTMQSAKIRRRSPRPRPCLCNALWRVAIHACSVLLAFCHSLCEAPRSFLSTPQRQMLHEISCSLPRIVRHDVDMVLRPPGSTKWGWGSVMMTLEQWFPTGGPRTEGGPWEPRGVVRERVRYYLCKSNISPWLNQNYDFRWTRWRKYIRSDEYQIFIESSNDLRLALRKSLNPRKSQLVKTSHAQKLHWKY